MNASSCITQFRTDTSVDIIQVPDATAVIWMNRVYRDLINIIRQKINEDYFYNEWTTDTVANQREYLMKPRSVSEDWMVKIKWISLKYKSTDDYKKCRAETLSNLDRDLQWYELNQPQSDPIYIISDKSIFIYPQPTEVITNWIIFYWIWDPIDLTSTTAESDIKIPLEFHDLLPLWMKQYYYGSSRMINEKNDAKNDYLVARQEMLSNLTDRIVVPVESTMPNLSYLS